MTKDDIIRMAQEAGFAFDGVNTRIPLWISRPEELERFAALVAAAEREAIEQRLHKLDITLNTRLYVINHAVRTRSNHD